MVEKTFKELIEFNKTWNEWFRKSPSMENTKIGYAIRRVIRKSIQPIFDEYNLELSSIRIDHAKTDGNGILMLDHNPTGRGFQYDSEGLKEVLKGEHTLDKIWNPKKFSIEPYFCKEENIPADITDEQREMFEGLIIKITE